MKKCDKCGEQKGSIAFRFGGESCSTCMNKEKDDRRVNNCKMIEIDRAKDRAEFNKLMGGMFA